jgi:hypothetical protein
MSVFTFQSFQLRREWWCNEWSPLRGEAKRRYAQTYSRCQVSGAFAVNDAPATETHVSQGIGVRAAHAGCPFPGQSRPKERLQGHRFGVFGFFSTRKRAGLTVGL